MHQGIAEADEQVGVLPSGSARRWHLVEHQYQVPVLAGQRLLESQITCTTEIRVAIVAWRLGVWRVSLKRIGDCASFFLGKATRAASRRACELLSPECVTPPQHAVLRALAGIDGDGRSLTALSARLVLDSATVTELADRLEAAGLAGRRADAGADRCVSRLHLTTRDRRLTPALDAAMDALDAEVAARLGADEGRIFEALPRLAAG